MAEGLESLSSREYPGRVIIIGQDPSEKSTVIVYVITGRSPSSQARKLVLESDAIWVKPTDEEAVRKGNVDLLVYPAIQFASQGIVVSNGKQTADIIFALNQSQNPVEVLSSALNEWDYEPDEPAFTPRISGCVLPGAKAALSVIRRGADGSSLRDYYPVLLKPGEGRMIATYSGVNTDPLPSFVEEPLAVKIQSKRSDEMAESVYEALGPEAGQADFRVSVACVYSGDFSAGQNEIYIINRNERMRD